MRVISMAMQDGETSLRLFGGSGLSQRPEQPSDVAFRYALFCQSRGPGEDFTFLDEVMRDRLLRQQFAGQSATYQARYPEARFEILLQDHQPIGRIVVDYNPEAITIVDLALLPDWRRRGIGSYVINTVLAEAKAAQAVRLSVLANNVDALRLYRRLGFETRSASQIEICLEYKSLSC